MLSQMSLSTNAAIVPVVVGFALVILRLVGCCSEGRIVETTTNSIGTFCARGRSGTPQGPQRATGDRHVGETQFRLMEADRRPRLGGPEEYKRSTRFPRGGAGRRSAGMRPDSLSTPEDGLGKRLRPCFLKGFYDDHVKRYKKRPIYWLITSPKGTLQALIYLHRYNRDTVNRFLNDYLRPYQQKLEAKRVSAEHVLTGGGSSQSEKTKAQKRIDEFRKALEELSTWERDVVRPLAEKRIELDLDDGVKVNYGKLGAILATVKKSAIERTALECAVLLSETRNRSIG
jgi:hypothetical protein